jgi:DNA-directed RNA polymerase specialized sigma24 family protein
VDSQRPAAAADQALRSVLAGNLGRAYLLARRVLGDPERAEDAVQEAALRCIRRPPDSSDPRAAATWPAGLERRTAR